MRGDKLTISSGDSDRFVWLVIDSPPLSQREGIWLRDGFGVQDIHDAIDATGWARRDGDGWRMTADIRCEPLRNVIDEMITGYFKASGVPTADLLQVQSALAEYSSGPAAIEGIPLLACAWLDVMVRDDLADEARSVKNAWSERTLRIDCETHCERRAKELLARFSAARQGIVSKMAESKATRTSDESRATRGA